MTPMIFVFQVVVSIGGVQTSYNTKPHERQLITVPSGACERLPVTDGFVSVRCGGVSVATSCNMTKANASTTLVQMSGATFLLTCEVTPGTVL